MRVLIPAVLQDCAPILGRTVLSLSGESMGTSWQVQVAAHPEQDRAYLEAAIHHALQTIIDQMSTWEADSVISRFNQAEAGSWLAIPAPFDSVLECALSLAATTDGAFDPTAGRLVNLWGFGPHGGCHQQTHAVPTAEAIAAERARCSWRRLTWDRDRQRLQQPGGIYLDLSGIAKGFAVDHVTQCLRTLGHCEFLVEIGGELRGEGCKPDGQPWWIELELPPAFLLHSGADSDSLPPAQYPLERTRVALHGLSVATSGNYRRFFAQDDQLHGHTIDPRTGYPTSRNLLSVTVLHPSCMHADALATALTVLGAQSGLAYANRQAITAIFLENGPHGPTESCSNAFLGMLD